MDVLYKIFLLPLRETARLNPQGAPLSLDEVVKIFGNIEAIIEINKDLYANLLKLQENWSNSILIGPTFIKYIPMLRIYIEYVNNYSIAIDTLVEAKKKKYSKNFYLMHLVLQL